MVRSNYVGAFWAEAIGESDSSEWGSDHTFTFAWRFSDTVSRNGVCLLGGHFGDRALITHVALYQRRNKATTLDRVIRLSEFESLTELPLDALLEEVPSRQRRFVREGSIPPGTWKAVRAALHRLRPEAMEAVRRIESRLGRSVPFSGGAARDSWAMERDAFCFALDLAGVPRRELTIADLSEEPAPFLQGLTTQIVREDALIQHDASVFGEWDQIQNDIVGGAEFRGPRGERLTIINANRTPIETTLGVDLIYFNHQFESYILVQYKMLRRKGDSPFVYRPTSDKSLESELKRMRQLRPGGEPAGNRNYRLGDEFCFLKFCKNEKALRCEPEILEGLYVPLGYWDMLYQSGSLRGPRGGLIVSYESVPRSISARQITDLIKSGWVGSSGQRTEQITDVISCALKEGRSVVMAGLAQGGRDAQQQPPDLGERLSRASAGSGPLVRGKASE